MCQWPEHRRSSPRPVGLRLFTAIALEKAVARPFGPCSSVDPEERLSRVEVLPILVEAPVAPLVVLRATRSSRFIPSLLRLDFSCLIVLLRPRVLPLPKETFLERGESVTFSFESFLVGSRTSLASVRRQRVASVCCGFAFDVQPFPAFCRRLVHEIHSVSSAPEKQSPPPSFGSLRLAGVGFPFAILRQAPLTRLGRLSFASLRVALAISRQACTSSGGRLVESSRTVSGPMAGLSNGLVDFSKVVLLFVVSRWLRRCRKPCRDACTIAGKYTGSTHLHVVGRPWSSCVGGWGRED